MNSPVVSPVRAERLTLRAGPLVMSFEGGGLRNILWGGREIIRRIYVAVRDRNWGTVPGEISAFQAEVATDRFHLGYTCTHRSGEIHFVWQAEIVGESDGNIRFRFTGEAKTTFLRNRIGFCVLHPADCAGVRCRTRPVSGTVAELTLPRFVEAAQPIPGFEELVALSHEVSPGVWAELQFDGEQFEMEDQRNWIDASFKTFCTPLRLPYPVEVAAGTKLYQEVRCRILGTAILSALDAPASETVRVDLLEARRPLPPIGLGWASQDKPLSAREAACLTGLRLGHLRAEVRLGQSDWPVELERARQHAAQLQLPLELAVHLPVQEGSDAVEELVRLLRRDRTALARVLLFRTGEKTVSAESVALARPLLVPLGVPVGAGSDADFYQLNQFRPPHEQADFIHWSMNPQTHASDETSIAETPTAIAAQIESARIYFPDKWLVVSPVTLKPRFNPVATRAESSTEGGTLPVTVDPRQLTPFAAAWTLAMIKHLTEQGVNGVTLFETIGWQGVMERENGSPLPALFPSLPGQLFPLYHVLAAFGAFVGGEVVVSRSSEPFRVESVALTDGSRICLWLANLTADPQQVTVTGFSRATHRFDLDWSDTDGWMFNPALIQNAKGRRLVPAAEAEISLELEPFALLRLELE